MFSPFQCHLLALLVLERLPIGLAELHASGFVLNQNEHMGVSLPNELTGKRRV